MRHTVVTRIVVALASVLLAAASGFAWHHATRAPALPLRAGPHPARQAPPESFEQHCAACHAAEELAGPLAAAADRATAVLDLLALLAEHGAADPAEDLEIVRWLHGLTAQEDELPGQVPLLRQEGLRQEGLRQEGN